MCATQLIPYSAHQFLDERGFIVKSSSSSSNKMVKKHRCPFLFLSTTTMSAPQGLQLMSSPHAFTFTYEGGISSMEKKNSSPATTSGQKRRCSEYRLLFNTPIRNKNRLINPELLEEHTNLPYWCTETEESMG